MKLTKLRLTKDASNRLRFLAGRTALTPNLLCRIGFCLSLSRPLQKFTNVFLESARGTELDEELGEILTSELPLEGPGRGLPVILKIQEAFSDGVEIGKIIGCQDLPLDNREVDFDLVEPTGMDGGMHEPQAGVEMAKALNGSGATMRRAVIHDPEDATGVVIRWSCHHLLDKPVKGGDAILRFTAAKNSGAMDVQCGDIGPSTAAKVLVLDVHGSARPAALCGMLATAGLNAGLFIGGDHEFIILQRPVLPLAGIEIQHLPGLGGEVRVTGEDPTAVVPRPNGIFMQPTPQGAATDRGHQTALLDLLNQIAGAPAGQRPTVLGG